MLKDRLLDDLKEAMKNKDIIGKNTIQSIRASVLQYEKDRLVEADDKLVEDIIVKEKKKRTDALEQFKKANREDLINQTEQEISILEGYLPEMLSEEDIRKELQIIIDNIPDVNIKMFGKIMGEAKQKLGNTADGKMLSEILKDMLK